MDTMLFTISGTLYCSVLGTLQYSFLGMLQCSVLKTLNHSVLMTLHWSFSNRIQCTSLCLGHSIVLYMEHLNILFLGHCTVLYLEHWNMLNLGHWNILYIWHSTALYFGTLGHYRVTERANAACGGVGVLKPILFAIFYLQFSDSFLVKMHYSARHYTALYLGHSFKRILGLHCTWDTGFPRT